MVFEAHLLSSEVLKHVKKEHRELGANGFFYFGHCVLKMQTENLVMLLIFDRPVKASNDLFEITA